MDSHDSFTCKGFKVRCHSVQRVRVETDGQTEAFALGLLSLYL